MNETEFSTTFKALTSNPPFPWQWTLYQRFVAGKFPSSCNLPTGLGKTSVIHIWLIALAHAPDQIPRRLVYVVNRRTVVDQSTNEAIYLRAQVLGESGPPHPAVSRLRTTLEQLASDPSGGPLAISTLRGQFADNREWSSDPARPAVIAGTVDMIGSRLLFSGYGCGFKTRPLHAGFLGQDALLVHDEAHLEPAFQKLIAAIECEQHRESSVDMKSRRLRVMELTATTRGQQAEPFGLTGDDLANDIVKQRIYANKGLAFHPVKGEKGATAETIGDLAVAHRDSGQAILLFVRTIDDVNVVAKKLAATKADYELLTGTRRGKERDELVRKPVFNRFRPAEQQVAAPGTVYLLCTSAGEVGIDISADRLVCDLTPFDSMAQRFGRVNRRGGDDKRAHIDVVYETSPDPKKKDDLFEQARWATLDILRDQLAPCDWDAQRQDASPASLGNAAAKLSEQQRRAAFTPQPAILPTSDILFDAWALTTIRGKLPGRPMVEPYLHGISGWEPPETNVAWREEVGVITGELLKQYEPEGLLEDYPLKPHELLRDNSSRVFDRLKKLKASGATPVWVVSDDGAVGPTTLEAVIEGGKDVLNYKTLLLPPDAGGLENGMLTSTPAPATDVADDWRDEKNQQRRVRLWDGDERLAEKWKVMRLIRTIDLDPPEEDEDGERRSWHWFELPAAGDGEGSRNSKKSVLWKVHTNDVVCRVDWIVPKLTWLSEGLKRAVHLAARFHDLGKRRVLFQHLLGNTDPTILLAKSGKKGGRIEEQYRHEFGSLIDTEVEADFQNLPGEEKELVLHLIAAHHGRGRPHFPVKEAFDRERSQVKADEVARAVPQRFAKLQRKYGRWGLAYLESLLRAADYAASAKPSEFVGEKS